MMEKWKEQWNRVNRWYKIYEKINNGIELNEEKNPDYCKDMAYSFFINCFQLKDWIINDGTLSIKKDEVENFINFNECMSLCSDICNSLKHLEHRNRANQNLEISSVTHKLELSIKGQIYRAKYNISTSKGDKDAFEIATECLVKWQEFIDNNIR